MIHMTSTGTSSVDGTITHGVMCRCPFQNLGLPSKDAARTIGDAHLAVAHGNVPTLPAGIDETTGHGDRVTTDDHGALTIRLKDRGAGNILAARSIARDALIEHGGTTKLEAAFYARESVTLAWTESDTAVYALV